MKKLVFAMVMLGSMMAQASETVSCVDNDGVQVTLQSEGSRLIKLTVKGIDCTSGAQFNLTRGSRVATTSYKGQRLEVSMGLSSHYIIGGRTYDLKNCEFTGGSSARPQGGL